MATVKMIRFWPIRALNGDLLANIKAGNEEEALAIYFAMEERRLQLQVMPDLPDGRTLLRPTITN